MQCLELYGWKHLLKCPPTMYARCLLAEVHDQLYRLMVKPENYDNSVTDIHWLSV